MSPCACDRVDLVETSKTYWDQYNTGPSFMERTYDVVAGVNPL